MYSPDIIGIIGFGSVSQKHLIRLAKICYLSHFVIFTRQIHIEVPIELTHRVKITNNILTLLRSEPEIVIIATPANEHQEYIAEIFNTAKKVLIEKPLASNLINAKIIESAAYKAKCLVGVGYNLRFTNGLDVTKNAINSGQIGQINHIDVLVGQRLETWRPRRDYRDTVSAKSQNGGGVLRELSHEIDLACFLFGWPNHMTLIRGKMMYKDIDVEDTAFMQGVFSNGNPLIASIRLDFNRLTPKRSFVICGEDADLEWNLLDGSVYLNTQSGKEKLANNPKDTELSYEKMFDALLNHQFKNGCTVTFGTKLIALIEDLETKGKTVGLL